MLLSEVRGRLTRESGDFLVRGTIGVCLSVPAISLTVMWAIVSYTEGDASYAPLLSLIRFPFAHVPLLKCLPYITSRLCFVQQRKSSAFRNHEPGAAGRWAWLCRLHVLFTRDTLCALRSRSEEELNTTIVRCLPPFVCVSVSFRFARVPNGDAQMDADKLRKERKITLWLLLPLFSDYCCMCVFNVRA